MVRTILAALLITLGLVTPARAAIYEAEDFSHDSTARVTNPRTASGGHALAFTETGSASTPIAAADQLTVVGRGGLPCDGFPHLVLSVDGTQLADYEISEYGWTSRTLTDVPAGTLTVSFPNGLQTPDCWRVLRVDVLRTTDAAPEPWRAFADDSIWNTPADDALGTNPNASLFTSYDPGLIIGGGPAGSSSHDRDYAKPIFYAQPGDPCVPVTEDEPSWVSPSSGVKLPDCVELPDGATWAHGSDGHMGIVSSDGSYFFQFWRVTQADSNGIRSTDGSAWALDGPGVQNCCGSAGGRGSGTPIITTTLTPEDARDGINHALGVTVPNVSSSYVYPPASKSDGDCGCGIKYGQRYVLRPDFPETGSVGRVNVIRGLKTYGMIVVDQGASFEIDSTGDYRPGEAALWTAAGIDRTALNDIRPDDLRFVP